MIRSGAAAVLGALASAVWLALFYTGGGGLRVEFAVDPPRFVSGFYSAERNTDTGQTFAWTGPETVLRLPGIDRRVPWMLTVHARDARRNVRPSLLLSFFVDGIQLHTQEAPKEFADIKVLVPARPDRRGVTILMRSSATFVPGPQDPRQLGVMVDRLELSPNGLVLPPAAVFARAMFAGAALAAAIALLGVTAGSAIGAAVLLSAGHGALLARGFGPYSNFPDIVAVLAFATAAVLVVVALIVRWRRQRLRNTARFAIAFTAGACFLKLLVLLHPDMPIGDALFQAHRFQGVLRGDLYFTSIAPGGYAFPYAPGLYVAASPFAGLVRRELGDVMLLRIVTTVADAAAALLLYVMAAGRGRPATENSEPASVVAIDAPGAGGRDRLGGAFAVALHHLMPLAFGILTVGNLTNAFAQSLSVGALALMTSPSVRSVATGATLALTLVLTAAFLSHTSTFAILSVSAFMTAGLFFWKGAPGLRSAAKAVAVASLVAMVLAVVLYYAHFIGVYRTEFGRLSSETATAAPDAGGRGVLERAFAVPRYVTIYFGLPVLGLAAAGSVDKWRRGSRDRLTLAVAACGLTCVLFLMVGVLTPVDMRYYLAAIPVLALLGGAGASWWWKSGGLARIAALILLAGVVWIGVGNWWRAH